MMLPEPPCCRMEARTVSQGLMNPRAIQTSTHDANIAE